MAKKSVADKMAFPLSRVYLELTNNCNMECTFCPYPIQTRSHGRMEFDLLKKIVNELAEKKIAETIEIRGYGEPLMHPECYKISKYIIGSGIKLNITT
ncbi:MAG: radical SAM protein, partial [Chlorobiales bacterium]|nr:radical SAM protein [Chlorobiales bacterium]